MGGLYFSIPYSFYRVRDEKGWKNSVHGAVGRLPASFGSHRFTIGWRPCIGPKARAATCASVEWPARAGRSRPHP